MNRVRIDDLPWEEIRSPGGKFHSFFRNLSVALGGIRNTGPGGGGHPFDLQLRRIPPGASVCPYHSHLAQWELYVIRAGAGGARAPEGAFPVKAGDVFVHPPGEPHQLTNTGATDLEVLIIADNPPLDACYYPDSDKWALRPPGKVFRLTEVDYLDGEEAPVAGAPPYRFAPAPAAPRLAPFVQRLASTDAIPWDPWITPKGKYHQECRNLSGAVGDVLNGWPAQGHPFNLELTRIPPGKVAGPFHAHAAQWELFLFLDGAGTVRTAAGTTQVAAGHAILHPPGEAHQLINPGGAELLYYLVADNPPADYWHYPDSNKWGLRAPRRFFRMTEADYLDGEE